MGVSCSITAKWLFPDPVADANTRHSVPHCIGTRKTGSYPQNVRIVQKFTIICSIKHFHHFAQTNVLNFVKHHKLHDLRRIICVNMPIVPKYSGIS
jgi:hypothetical protein